MRYPADPPPVEEIVAVMRTAGDGAHGQRLRGLIVVLWRAGLRIQEALALGEVDLDPAAARFWFGAARAAAAARSAWTTGAGNNCSRGSQPARAPRRAAVLHHQRADARTALVDRRRAQRARAGRRRAGVRRRFAPHQLRHAHAVEMAREGVPLVVIQRQLGHSNLGITSVYLQGIDNAEIIDTVHARRAPMVQVNALLRP